MFETINTAGTGLQTYHTWLDTVAENIANVGDTATDSGQVFHQRYVQAGENAAGDGVHVVGVTAKGDTGLLTHDPANPIADAGGNVVRADVNLSEQMGDMILAQRAFQANASVVDRAKSTYEAAIAIGKGI